MAPFIHYNVVICKELNFILEKNSIKYLISFHKKNLNNLVFKKEYFYDSCLKNNLNIIKYIHYQLHNKNIDYKEALYNSCNQYNIKLIFWLCKIYNFSNNDFYNSLFYCINYNNLKLFKYLIKENNLDVSKNDNELLIHCIKKNNNDFIKYLLSNYNLKLNLNDDLARILYITNDNDIIDNIINITNNFEVNQSFIILFEEIIKLGFTNSFQKMIQLEQISIYFRTNIYKCIYYSFISNNIEMIKLVISLNYHTAINYDYMYSHFVTNGNLEIIKFIYEKYNNINLYNYADLQKVIKNQFYDIFLYIIKEKPVADLDIFYFKEFERLINDYFYKIILNIKDDELLIFLNYLSKNDIKINHNNIFNLTNYLVTYNQIDKIKIIHFKYGFENTVIKHNLFEDSLKSYNIDTIYYALNLLEKDINDFKYQILNYSYLNGNLDIINLLDEDNDFELLSYNLILIKNIYKDNHLIIDRVVSKKNFSTNFINSDIIQSIIKLGNIKILKIILPKLNNINDFEMIDEIIYNDNFEMIHLLKMNSYNFDNIKPNLLLKICKFGNLKFLDWFINLNINYDNFTNIAFNTLILYGHYDQATYFYNISENKMYIDLTNNNFALLRDIIKNDNLNMIKWFLYNFNDLNNIQFLIFLELQENIYLLAKNDNPEILKFVLNKYNLKSSGIIKKLYTYSFQNLNSNIINYLSGIFNLKDYNLELDFKNIFYNSIKNNNYDMIDIIIRNINNFNWINLILYYDYDYSNLLNYLFKNHFDYLQINKDKFYNILYHGNLNYIKIYLEYCSSMTDLKLINEDDYIILFSHNNLELLDYVYNLNKINFDNNENILKLIINLNKTEILDWYFDNFKFDNLHFDNGLLYSTSIILKNIDIIKILYENDNLEEFNNNVINYLKLSSKIKDISIFIWLSDKINDLDYTLENNVLISNSVSMNNILVFKYILGKANIDINYNDGYIITTAFGHNFNNIVKFLFEKYKNIDVLIKNQILMKYAVEDADIEMLDLLYNYNSNFDLSLDNEYLFRIACKMDNIEVVEWLYNKKNTINYSINDHEIFYYVCNNNYKKVALFLKNIDSTLYHVEIKDEEIINYFVNKNLEIKNTVFKENIDKCPICIDKQSDVITNCNHHYCFSCLDMLNKKNHILNCALCRNNILNISHLKTISKI